MKSLIETGLEASQVARSFSGIHIGSNGGGGRLVGVVHDKKHLTERPKSTGAAITSNNSIKSNGNEQVIETSSRSITPELPPVPSISRSNVLRDLKSLTRRKSGQTKFNSCHQQQQQQPQKHDTISEDSSSEKEGRLYIYRDFIHASNYD